MDGIGRLTPAQQEALRGVLGLTAVAGDRPTAAALLTPLADAADEQPVLVVVDDALGGGAAIRHTAAECGPARTAATGRWPTGLGYAVADYGLVLAVVQLRLVPRYLGLPFLPGA